ncbi:MAG: aconitase X catalytic domain-containing protein [Candidatus Helarchaeota archaeon]|nr:aconitase X catalytic domain-containing protein [Candidatus Helarchaeota archaeon]
MHLTKEEEKILNGEQGIAQQEALKLLIRYGEALGAEKLIEVQSVHTAMAVPEQFAKVIRGNYPLLNQVLLCSKKPVKLDKLKVFTTTHVCNIEPYHYREFSVSEEVMQANRDIRAHYAKQGIVFTSTCTPYLVGNVPVKGNHIAWMESSAVVYANSVIGALGNIEGIESTLAAAIVGKIPYAGFHVPENRKAKVVVQIDVKLIPQSDFDALGYFIGEELENMGLSLDVPILTGFKPEQATQDNFKGMGAAMATSGAVQLYHIEGITPEACIGLENTLVDPKKTEKVTVTDADIKKTYDTLSTATDPRVDLIIMGCPHFSLNQLKEVALLLEGKSIKKDVYLWIFIPAGLKELAMARGFGEIIEQAGGVLMVDTCPALTQFKPVGVEVVASNSAKQIHYYTAEFPEISTWFGSVEDCIQAAVTGKWGA